MSTTVTAGVADVLAGRRQWAVVCTDVLAGLASLPDGSVSCVITSPPYYSLRDYGTATWEGGSADCDHLQPAGNGHLNAGFNERWGHASGAKKQEAMKQQAYVGTCGRCGAVRIDAQIGLEGALDCAGWATGARCGRCYICTMTAVFAEVRRVLHPSGTCWVNIGDAYAANRAYQVTDNKHRDVGNNGGMRVPSGLKPKDLMLQPARLALSLQNAGWWVRSLIVWAKRAPMPESVTDRPTSSHETIWLLSKRAAYFYDAEAVREKTGNEATPEEYAALIGKDWSDRSLDRSEGRGLKGVRAVKRSAQSVTNPGGRNQRNVWHLSPEPLGLGHYAAFPTEIPRRAILAGTSERGICPAPGCGAPWRRIVKTSGGTIGKGWHDHSDDGERGQRGGTSAAGWSTYRREHSGFEPTCDHGLDPVSALILDPFVGSGTTCLVALRLGRRAIGFDLSPEYVRLAEARVTGDAPLFNAEGNWRTE